MFRKIYSYLRGIKINSLKFSKYCPFVIGNPMHIIPQEIWDEDLKNQLKYCFEVHRWDGFKWVYVERLELSEKEIREKFEKKKDDIYLS